MQRVYLDTCMVIHLIEGSSRQQQILKRALQTSFLMVYEQFFKDCQLIDLNRTVFEQATDLRVSYNLKTPDTLHLAAALGVCDQFWTNDKQLVKLVNDNLRQNLRVEDRDSLEEML